MTTSDWKKTFKQLNSKPNKKKRYIKHNKPKARTTGFTQQRCNRCGRYRAHVSQYGLSLCRQCFREIAKDIEFKKFS